MSSEIQSFGRAFCHIYRDTPVIVNVPLVL